MSDYALRDPQSLFFIMNRRGFIKSLLAAATVAAVPVAELLDTKLFKDARKKLSFSRGEHVNNFYVTSDAPEWGDTQILMYASWDRKLSKEECDRVHDGESPLSIPGCTRYFDSRKNINLVKSGKEITSFLTPNDWNTVCGVVKPHKPLNWIDVSIKDL